MYALIRSAQNNRTTMSGLFVVILIRSVKMPHFRNDILDEEFCLSFQPTRCLCSLCSHLNILTCPRGAQKIYTGAPIYNPWVFTSNHNPRPTRPNPTNIANTNANPDLPTPADRVIKPQPKTNPTQPDRYRYSNANPDPPTPADRVVPILALGRSTPWAGFLSALTS